MTQTCHVTRLGIDLPGAQDTLPYVGQLTALYLSPAEELFVESEDLESAFCPLNGPPAVRTPGSAFGRPDLGKVRPALTVVPMGWKSAVTLVQADLVMVPALRPGRKHCLFRRETI